MFPCCNLNATESEYCYLPCDHCTVFFFHANAPSLTGSMNVNISESRLVSLKHGRTGD